MVLPMTRISSAEAPAAPMRGSNRYLLASAGAGIAILLLALGAAVLGNYEQSVLTRAFLFAVPALTVGVLWGFTGVLTFSQGAFFGIGCYAAGLAFTHLGFNAGIAVGALLAGMIAAAAIAGLVSWLSFWYGATSLYVAVVTLVVPIVVVQLIYSGGSFTGSSSGLVGFPVPELSKIGWYWVAGLLLVATTAVIGVFLGSDFGSVLRAIRDNEQRSLYLGIRTGWIKGLLMMAMAAICAVAGYVYTCVGVIASSQQAGFVFGTELVINVALGGRSSVLGPVFGTVGLEWINAYLSGFLPFVWKFIVGVIFVGVILLLPDGILGALWNFIRRVSPAMRKAERGEPPAIVLKPSLPRASRQRADSRAALELTGVTKNYGALRVLEGIDLNVASGELVAIVGPNGAGKTTLMRCISDGMERTAGTIRIEGVSIEKSSPAEIVSLGLGRSFQNTNVYDTLTVTECLRLARYRHERLSFVEKAPVIHLPEVAHEVLTATGLQDYLGETVANLSHGMKRALELAMVLAMEPTVLILDEPTAGLTKEDRHVIGDILRDLQKRHGIAILLIEHDFDFVKQVCSRLVVLHRGKLVIDGTAAEVTASPIVQDIYSGQAQ